MLVGFLLKVIYVYIIGFVLAVLEIQIEGAHGWAEKLPAWRPKTKSKIGRLIQSLTKKELTGYHLALTPFLLLFFHWPFVMGLSWTLQLELEVLAFFAIFAVFWDFLWFVLNPNYSLRIFGPEKVWWHKKWLDKFPVDYYIGILVSVMLFMPLIIADPFVNLLKLLILLIGILIMTIITILLYPKAY